MSRDVLDNFAYRLGTGEIGRSFLQGRIFPREASAKPKVEDLHPAIKLAMWQEACEILIRNGPYTKDDASEA